MADIPSPPIEADEKTREIIHAVLCVKDPALRPGALGDKLIALNDDLVIQVILRIHTLVCRGHQGARELWTILIDPRSFVGRLGKFRKSRIYHLAARAGLEEIQSLFSSGVAARKSDGGEQNFQVHGLADLTLGERLSMARKPNKEHRSKAAFDPDPRVIENLLTNARTTEMEVLKIAARRPNEGRILEAISRSRKWISRYQIRIALVRNPYTPANISKNLLPQLLLRDLIEVRDDSALDMPLRQAALALIEQKRKSAPALPLSPDATCHPRRA